MSHLDRLIEMVAAGEVSPEDAAAQVNETAAILLANGWQRVPDMPVVILQWDESFRALPYGVGDDGG